MRADRVPVGRSGIIRVWRAAWAPMSGSSRQAWLTSTLRRIPRGMRVAPGRRVECRDRPRFAQPATAGMSRTTRARRGGDVRDRIDRQRRRSCGPAVPRCRAARPCRRRLSPRVRLDAEAVLRRHDATAWLRGATPLIGALRAAFRQPQPGRVRSGGRPIRGGCDGLATGTRFVFPLPARAERHPVRRLGTKAKCERDLRES